MKLIKFPMTPNTFAILQYLSDQHEVITNTCYTSPMILGHLESRMNDEYTLFISSLDIDSFTDDFMERLVASLYKIIGKDVPNDTNLIERLQKRVEELEEENQRLQTQLDVYSWHVPKNPLLCVDWPTPHGSACTPRLTFDEVEQQRLEENEQEYQKWLKTRK